MQGELEKAAARRERRGTKREKKRNLIQKIFSAVGSGRLNRGTTDAIIRERKIGPWYLYEEEEENHFQLKDTKVKMPAI